MSYSGKDRLRAIAGMIHSISARTGEVFVHRLLNSGIATKVLWWQWTDCKGDPGKVPMGTGRQVDAPTWSWGSVAGSTQPFRSRRVLDVLRHEPWHVEMMASIVGDLAIVRMQPSSSVDSHPVCRVDFTAPLIEAVIGGRTNLRRYYWTIRAARLASSASRSMPASSQISVGQ